MAMAVLAFIAANIATWENRNRQDVELAPFPTETNLNRYTRYLKEMNRGAMRSFQTDIDDVETECLEKTDLSNADLAAMFDENNYVNGEINQSEFLEKFQVFGFKLMDQFEECGVNEFLITLDSALNNIPTSSSAISSLGTQIALGWETEDTSIYLAKA